MDPATVEPEQREDLARAASAVQRIDAALEVAGFFAHLDGATVSYERVFASQAIDQRLKRLPAATPTRLRRSCCPAGGAGAIGPARDIKADARPARSGPTPRRSAGPEVTASSAWALRGARANVGPRMSDAVPEHGSAPDPILEEVRLFYESHHDGIEASRRRHHYFYDYLTRIFRVRVPEGLRVLDLGCGSGDLLAALRPSYGVGIDISSARDRRRARAPRQRVAALPAGRRGRSRRARGRRRAVRRRAARQRGHAPDATCRRRSSGCTRSCTRARGC